MKTTDQVYDIYYDDTLTLTTGSYNFSATNYDPTLVFIKGSNEHKEFVNALDEERNPAFKLYEHTSIYISGTENVAVYVLHKGNGETVEYTYSNYPNTFNISIQDNSLYLAKTAKHQLYSGQTVKLEIDDYGSGSFYLKSENQQIWLGKADNEMMITSTGE